VAGPDAPVRRCAGFPFGVGAIFIFFFFLEAIFAGIYLWGWRRLPGWAHWWSGVPIALAGIFGAMSVIAVNPSCTPQTRPYTPGSPAGAAPRDRPDRAIASRLAAARWAARSSKRYGTALATAMSGRRDPPAAAAIAICRRANS
jgi:Cytochrome bd terminal oxidase subunit I